MATTNQFTPEISHAARTAWRAMRGITHLSVHTVGMGLVSPGEHVKVLEQFKKDVLG